MASLESHLPGNHELIDGSLECTVFLAAFHGSFLCRRRAGGEGGVGDGKYEGVKGETI